jgi:hypothetical protein
MSKAMRKSVEKGNPVKYSFIWRGPKQSSIRIDKGDANATNPTQRVDHVVINDRGRVLGRDGKPITGSVAQDYGNSHIPYNEWVSWKSWNSKL